MRRSTTIPIASGEREFTRFDFQDLLERRALDIAQPEVARTGGMTEIRRIAALTSAHGVRLAPHAWGSGVLFAASIHVGSRPRRQGTGAAELAAVAVSFRIAAAVFLPEQQQCHAAPLQLLVHPHPINRATLNRGCPRPRKQPPLKRRVIEVLRHRPGDPNHLRAADVSQTAVLPTPVASLISR